MKETVDNLKIGLVLAIVGIGGGAYHYSRLQSQVDFNTASIAGIDSKLDQILAMRTDIEVIKDRLKDLKRPVQHTNRSVIKIEREVAYLTTKLGPHMPFHPGPVTQN